MKIAITAKEPSLESEVDQRFGRAKYFVVVDTDTNEIEIYDNEINLNAVQGAGIQSAQNVARFNVEAVLTGHVGPNSYRTLSAAGIAVFTGVAGIVNEAISMLKSGKLKPVNAADVEGHWFI